VADAIAPDGSEIRFVVPPATPPATRASLVEVRLAAGRTSRPVRHRTVEEIWYVTAGTGVVWRCPPHGEPVSTEVAPGSSLVIPTGWAFRFRAAHDADLRFLCWTSPPWPGPEEAEPVDDVAWEG
jgi:mannose-6-phosphate isomerase-like protein (cupin superfamily)